MSARREIVEAEMVGSAAFFDGVAVRGTPGCDPYNELLAEAICAWRLAKAHAFWVDCDGVPLQRLSGPSAHHWPNRPPLYIRP